jgi:hypothetical protein
MSEEVPVPHLWKSLNENDFRITKLHDATTLIHVWGLIDEEQAKGIFHKIERWSKESHSGN